MSAYESAGKSDEWYTPAYVFTALGERFDMDVAAPEAGPRHVPTARWFSQDGQHRPWDGFVWMNPPFGNQAGKFVWLHRFFEHGDGIALMPDRTSAPWFQFAAQHCSAMLFCAPKIMFERADGTVGKSPGAGTALFAAGDRAKAALIRASSLGFVSVTVAGKRDCARRGIAA